MVNDDLLLPTARGIDNGIPNIEARPGLELGPEKNGYRLWEVGISGLWGKTRASTAARFVLDNNELFFLPEANNVSTTTGGSIDVQLYGERAGFLGKFCIAQAADTYFAAVRKTLNPQIGDDIQSIGGWGEAYYKLNKCVTVYVGYGINDPRNQDLGLITTDVNNPSQRTLNRVIWGNIVHDFTDFFQLGLEISHRKTDYLNPLVIDKRMLVYFSSTLKY